MKPLNELTKARVPQLESGTYSGYQIETDGYIFDFDIEILDTYEQDAGTEFAPPTLERVSRAVSVSRLSVWHKAHERVLTLKPNIEQFLIERIETKFK